MPSVEVNGTNLLVTLAVILIVLEAISVLSKGVDAWKKLTGRDARAKEMADIKERLSTIEAWQKVADGRFKQGNDRFKQSEEDSTMSLLTLHAIVRHMQSGNDHDKLKETDDELYRYLLKRGIKKEMLG